MTACLLVAIAQSAFAAPPRCVIEPVPRKPAHAAPPAACHKAPQVIANVVRAKIAKRYQRGWDRGKVAVAFPCDGLGPMIREIVIENGDGHGGTLGIWRAKRAAPGYEVRGIAFAGSSMVYTQKSPPFELVMGRLSFTTLETVRSALAAKVSEQPPKLPPGSGPGESRIWRSRDFHILVRLVDDDGRVLERRYTGYEGSLDQDTFLGPEVAAEALAAITSLKSRTGSPTLDDRALFTERFNIAVSQFDDNFYWWVMERYVELARYFGTSAIIPGLLTRLTVAKPDRSKIDARADALEALAQITGWDARPGASVEDAAAAYLRECR